MSDDIDELREKKREALRARLEDEQATAEADAGGDRAAAPKPVAVDGRADLDALTGDHRVVLADFYADWCGPCQMLEPTVERVAAETPAAVAKVDVDANQQLAREFGVQGVPTLMLFVGGEPAERLVGMQQPERLFDLIERHTG